MPKSSLTVEIRFGPWLTDAMRVLDLADELEERLPDYLAEDRGEVVRARATLKRRIGAAIAAQKPARTKPPGTGEK